MLSEVIADLLAGDRGYQVIQQLPGIGPVLAAVIIAEIGDVHRFGGAAQLCSRAGLTPSHRESDTKVTRGHVTKMVCAGGTVPLRRPGGVRWRWLEDSICTGVS
jgi:transposase